MIDLWIIEKLKQQEENNRQDREQPRIELPIYYDEPLTQKENEVESEEKRGVIVINIYDDDDDEQ